MISNQDYINTVPDAPWHVSSNTDQYSGDDNYNNISEAHSSLETSHQEFEPYEEEPQPVSKELYVFNLKSTSTKKALDEVFSKYGIIRRIEINKNAEGLCDGTAMVYFAIPPFTSTFGGKQLLVDDTPIGTQFIPRETTLDTKTDGMNKQECFCKAQTVSLGTFTRPTTYQEMWKANRSVLMTINTTYHTLQIQFTYDGGITYKLDFPWSNLANDIMMETTNQNTTIFTFSLRYPPRLWRQDLDHNEGTTYWSRATELFMESASSFTRFASSPLTLGDLEDQVNFGAWTDYRLEFNENNVASSQFEAFIKELMKHDLLRHTLAHKHATATRMASGKKLKSYYNHSQRTNTLAFDVLYFLECAIAKRLLNQYLLDATFYDRLNQIGVDISCRILSWIISENTAKYNAFGAIQTAWQRIKHRPSSTTIPDGCCMVSSALVTPTTLQLLPPTLEHTNRALRQYSKYGDRFLRVSFVDEDLTLLTHTRPRDLKETKLHRQDALFNRVSKVMKDGIKIGNRHYSFLAFDSTQLSYHTCWFFAPKSELLACDIRKTLWNSESVTTLAKYVDAADICFQPTSPVPLDGSKNLDDGTMDMDQQQQQQQQQQQKGQKQSKKKGGRRQRPSQQERKQQQPPPKDDIKTIEFIDDLYTLTDKVRHICGKISSKMVHEVVQALELENIPSAIQYSLGGCLGVLALSNFINGKTKVQVRPCHYVFDKTPYDLQVVQSSSYAPAFLDRTLMALLSSVGVSGHIFMSMVQQTTAMMNSAFSDSTTATEYLKTFVSNGRNGIQTMRHMINAGLLSRRDPFLLNLLWIFRTKRLIEMKTKAALHVTKGAHLMVIIDETNTLKPDEVFCQISDLKSGQLSQRKQVKGPCFVVKQPCIHSGNIRLFEAVDHPALRHWYDVIVISSKYRDEFPRQHLDGKMDGQRFTIIWDPLIQPCSRLASTLNNRQPSDDATIPTKNKMTSAAAIDSFVNYVRNDHKDTLIRHYLMTTEKAAYNTQDSACIKLALQYADASDYTNIPCSITIDKTLESTTYPDYMEVPDTPTHQSHDIQGQIYRMISPTLYQNYTEQMVLKNSPYITYDPRMKVDGMEPYIIEARAMKNKYDHDLKTLMQQYGINTEVELVSGDIVDESRQPHKDQHAKAIFQERMAHAVATLQRHYLNLFHQEFEPVKVNDPTRPTLDMPVKRYNSRDTIKQKEIKAAAWYYVTYHSTERPKPTRTIMLSFPWLLPDILCSLARRQHNAIDDSALDRDAIEKYRTQSEDKAWITVDGDNDDDDDDDSEDDDEDDSDDSDDDELDDDSDDDNDDNDQLGPENGGITDTTTEQQQQQNNQNEVKYSVPVISVKLSDIISI